MWGKSLGFPKSSAFFCLLKAGSHIFQAGRKLIMKPNMTYELLTLLLKPTQYWSYRHAPSDLGGFLGIRYTEYKVKFSTK